MSSLYGRSIGYCGVMNADHTLSFDVKGVVMI